MNCLALRLFSLKRCGEEASERIYPSELQSGVRLLHPRNVRVEALEQFGVETKVDLHSRLLLGLRRASALSCAHSPNVSRARANVKQKRTARIAVTLLPLFFCLTLYSAWATL